LSARPGFARPLPLRRSLRSRPIGTPRYVFKKQKTVFYTFSKKQKTQIFFKNEKKDFRVKE
jgi:hypothetical protein